MELHRRGLPVGTDGAVQSRRGGAQGGGRTRGGRGGCSRVDGGGITGGVVGGSRVSPAGHRCSIGHAGVRPRRNTQRDGNRRIAGAGSQGIRARAGQVRQVCAPAVAAEGRGR